MENPEKIEIEGLKTIHKLCKFGADHNMEGCTFTEIVERMFSKIEQMKTQVNTLDEMLLNQGEVLAQAKAQAVPKWISVEDKLPETEPNADGMVCAVVCSVGNVYRARYMHDVDVGVDTKYWSEFSVDYHGMEHEHYEINAKITHWMPLPDAPQEPAND